MWRAFTNTACGPRCRKTPRESTVFGRPFQRTNDEIRVRLDDSVRALLDKVLEELRELLLVDDTDTLRRLYPPAYPDDPQANEGYEAIVRDQLLMQRLDDLDTVVGTIHDEAISGEVADAWMRSINQARLVLGTQLDVGETDEAIDPDDPDASNRVVYHVLSYVLEELTRVRTDML